MTDQQLLDNCRAAINSIFVGGQSYAINGRTFTRADLGELREMVGWLEARVATSSTTAGDASGFVLARFN